MLTDYTMSSPLLRRASVYLSVIGAVVLLTLGGAALIGTIPQSSIDAAEQATQHLIEQAGLTPADESAPPAEATTAP